MNEARALQNELTALIQKLEEEICILRGKAIRAEEEKKEFEEANKKLEDEKAELENENKKLEEKLALALFRQFGKHVERYMDEKQPLLFEGDEKSAPEIPLDAEEKDIVSYERRKRGRKKLDEKILRHDTYIDLSEEEKKCGPDEELVPIGEDIIERLHIIPEQVYVERIHIKKYVRRFGGEKKRTAIISGKVPANIMPGSIATAGLLAFIFTQKYCDYVPYYRQEAAFQRIGAGISRQNMANWQQKTCEKIEPLLDLIKAQVKSGEVIQMDETGMQVMNEPGRENKKKSYMWLARGGPPGAKAVWYEYHPGRGSEHAIQILKGFKGYFQSDGWSSYVSADAALPDVIHVGCWAHARRRFYEASSLERNSDEAREALAQIQQLYRIEREMRGKLESGEVGREAFEKERKEKSVPVLKAFKEWLAEHSLKSGLTWKLRDAIGYTSKQWDCLGRYLEHWELTPDNNAAERAIRPFVMGRKNWMMSGSVEGAESSCHLYSLIETAKVNGKNPYQYLKHVFEEAAQMDVQDDWSRLLPWNHLVFPTG